MSMVVFRDRQMAADTSLWEGYVMVAEREKIERLPDGRLIGCVGDCAIADPFMDWARQGFPAGFDIMPGDNDEDFEALVVELDGRINRYDHKFRREVSARPWAVIGMGQNFANGLLVAGYSAKKVVETSIKHIAYVGGKVSTLRLGPVSEAEVEEPVAISSWREDRGLA